MKMTNKERIDAAIRAMEKASAILLAVRIAAEQMEPCDISDAVDAGFILVNEARCDLSSLEGKL